MSKHLENYFGGFPVKKRLKVLKKIIKKFPSTILVKGKAPIEKCWTKYCTEKRSLSNYDLKNYNVGIPTGQANLIIVLDVDDRKKMKTLKEENGWKIPKTFTVKTGGGDRRHYYYSYPDNGNDYGNYGYNDRDSGKHVFDIKGIGGMVVAPGSRHPDTKRLYEIKRDLPIAPAPKWLLDLALKKKTENTSESDIKNEPMISNFLSKLKGVKQTSNNSWKALCPAHDDHDPSLSISTGNDGRILIHCFAHCSPEKILNRVGMSLPDLFPKPIDGAITVIDYVRETKEPNAVYNSIRVFADLTAAQLANVTQELKEILGDKLNLNDFKKAVNESEGYKTRNENNRPIIQANNRLLDQITEESLKVLYDSNDPPSIFVRSGEVVRLRADEHDRPIIETMNDAMLRGVLAGVTDFVKYSKGTKYISPPLDVVKNILSMGTWKFPPLEGIVEAPILRADGSVFNQQGYDKATSTYYIPAPNLKVPAISKEPTRKEIKEALNLMEEIFEDYPFTDDISKANTYALLLTPLIRPIFDGLVPMAVIDAPDKGTGKSMLADIIALIAIGRTASLMTAPNEEAEWRKKITSTLLEGAKTILIDNVTRPVHSDSLATVLTSSFWEDRVLGQNKNVRIRHKATWIITGNNIKISGDLPRRCYWIRIDAKTTQPWKRTGFKHENLPKWVSEKRGEILAALLTIVSAWFIAGSPKAEVKALGSYDEWAKIVGGILKFAGISGFLENIDAFYERTDDESLQWEDFLMALRRHYKKHSFTAKSLTARLKEDETLRSYLPDSLSEAFDNPKKSFERVFGKSLAQKEDVYHGKRQIRIKRVGMDGHAVRWKVVRKKLENSK